MNLKEERQKKRRIMFKISKDYGFQFRKQNWNRHVQKASELLFT